MELKDKLPEDLYSQVVEHLGDTKVILNDGSYIPKSRLDAEIEKKKAFESRVEELNGSLTEYQRKVQELGTDKELVEELKAKLESKDAEFQSKLKETEKSHKFDLALSSLKPKNVKAVKALFDTDKISVDGDNLIGFKEQAESILKENDFLFETEVKKPVPKGGDSPGGTNTPNPFNPKTLSLFEQIKLKKENPELYASKKKEAEKQGWL